MSKTNKNVKYGAGNKNANQYESIKTLNKGFMQGVVWTTIVAVSLFVLSLKVMGVF